jgi:hypothetical protein
MFAVHQGAAGRTPQEEVLGATAPALARTPRTGGNP